MSYRKDFYHRRKHSGDFNEEKGLEKLSETTPLKEGLDQLVGRLDPERKKLQYQSNIQRIWEELVGPSTLEHTQSIYLKEKVLYIWMDSSVWANEINLLKELYFERFASDFPELEIREIRVFASKAGKRPKSF